MLEVFRPYVVGRANGGVLFLSPLNDPLDKIGFSKFECAGQASGASFSVFPRNF